MNDRSLMGFVTAVLGGFTSVCDAQRLLTLSSSKLFAIGADRVEVKVDEKKGVRSFGTESQ